MSVTRIHMAQKTADVCQRRYKLGTLDLIGNNNTHKWYDELASRLWHASGVTKGVGAATSSPNGPQYRSREKVESGEKFVGGGMVVPWSKKA